MRLPGRRVALGEIDHLASGQVEKAEDSRFGGLTEVLARDEGDEVPRRRPSHRTHRALEQLFVAGPVKLEDVEAAESRLEWTSGLADGHVKAGDDGVAGGSPVLINDAAEEVASEFGQGGRGECAGVRAVGLGHSKPSLYGADTEAPHAHLRDVDAVRRVAGS